MTPLEVADSSVSGQALHKTQEELRRRGTHKIRHGTQALEQHLLNTFRILGAWQQPARVQYAGLMHSVYSTDVFNHQTFALDERDQVRALVGEAAEHLVHLFCTIDRRELLSAIRGPSHEAAQAFRLNSRLDGRHVEVTRQDAGDLLVIYMANAAEQSCRPDRTPARWLSSISALGRDAHGLAEVVPPVFDRCTTVISKAEEAHLILGYQEMIANLGRDDHPPSELARPREGRPADWPVVAEPLIWRSLRSIVDAGKGVDVTELVLAATALLEQWGTAWDKRLSQRQWLQLSAVLSDTTNADELAFVARRAAAANQSVSPEQLYMELARIGLLPMDGDDQRPLIAPPTDVGLTLPARFQSYLTALKTNHRKPRMTMYPGLRAMPWHDPREFRFAQELEAAADDIASEVHALSSNTFQDEAENIKRSGRWSVLFLYERGRKNEENCRLCPKTVAVIEANRTMLSLGGLAYFSMLEPGTHIAPHAGPTNMRLRCHLGIDVPANCGLRVGGIDHTWKSGRCLVFDDSFTHEAWNDGTEPRVALVVDLWHPDLTDDEVELLNGLHRYAAATGLGLIRYWNRNRAKAARPE